MVDFTIALFLQLGLLILLGHLLPGRRTENAARTWSPTLPFETSWEAAQRMIEREYGAPSRRGGYEEDE